MINAPDYGGMTSIAAAFGDTDAEIAANARLIALAPELVAALERLAARVEQIELPDGSTPDTLEARALLARIDGGTVECEFIRQDDSEWLCTTHKVTMIQKAEPVFCSEARRAI